MEGNRNKNIERIPSHNTCVIKCKVINRGRGKTFSNRSQAKSDKSQTTIHINMLDFSIHSFDKKIRFFDDFEFSIPWTAIWICLRLSNVNCNWWSADNCSSLRSLDKLSYCTPFLHKSYFWSRKWWSLSVYTTFAAEPFSLVSEELTLSSSDLKNIFFRFQNEILRWKLGNLTTHTSNSYLTRILKPL